ncbi:phospholipase A2, membrane associated-like [Sorex fumeus]|uniref:phospholipase A2, membrane associated-like n=1 Tax=Sorex fumeus TaxID=62283 RepID=UPI0024AD7B54|nr:phospholipase A2, membrane associated-like [Sorex fumeus]
MCLLQAHGAIWNFGSMLGKVIGKKAVIDYSLYGCYCGFRDKGTPKDATDQCCFERDCCYRRLRKEGCRTKFAHYKFEYKKDQVTCVDENPCRKKLCECDKTAALCFKENRNSYNKTYRFYSGRSCQGKSPQC